METVSHLHLPLASSWGKARRPGQQSPQRSCSPCGSEWWPPDREPSPHNWEPVKENHIYITANQHSVWNYPATTNGQWDNKDNQGNRTTAQIKTGKEKTFFFWCCQTKKKWLLWSYSDVLCEEHTKIHACIFKNGESRCLHRVWCQWRQMPPGLMSCVGLNMQKCKEAFRDLTVGGQEQKKKLTKITLVDFWHKAIVWLWLQKPEPNTPVQAN